MIDYEEIKSTRPFNIEYNYCLCDENYIGTYYVRIYINIYNILNQKPS